MLMASPLGLAPARAPLQGVPGTVNTIDQTRLLRSSVRQQLTLRSLLHRGAAGCRGYGRKTGCGGDEDDRSGPTVDRRWSWRRIGSASRDELVSRNRPRGLAV
jgi:hypothetical protein